MLSNSCPPSFPHLALLEFLDGTPPPVSLSASLRCTAEGSKCKSRWTLFFCRGLISADDVSKEVKRTTQRPPQLLSPIHRLQIYVSPSLFFLSLSLPLCSISYHIFNIINIDWAVHLETFFNNWLPSLVEALMVCGCG